MLNLHILRLLGSNISLKFFSARDSTLAQKTAAYLRDTFIIFKKLVDLIRSYLCASDQLEANDAPDSYSSADTQNDKFRTYENKI